MNGTREILAFLSGCMPLFSALIWMLMIWLSAHENRSRLERRIKITVLWLYIFTAVVWLSMLFYTYAPRWSIYCNIPSYLSFMLVPVQLYRYICELSETDKLGPFSLWHYALPCLIVLILGIWSFFVPLNVQVGLLESRGQISPEYPAYSCYFVSKPAMRLIYSIVYTGFSLLRLWRYYRTIRTQADNTRKPAHWIMGLIGFAVVILLITVPSVMLPRGKILTSWLVLVISVLLVGEHFIIGYNVIRGNFLLYIPSVMKRLEKTEPVWRKRVMKGHAEQPPMDIEVEPGPQLGVRLTKKRFENYVGSRKPWLETNIRMTDLVEPLETSRTSLSNFINKTYGVNFNRYINRLRLVELNRLLALPSNAGKTPDDLLYKAGFASKRNYIRAVEAERNSETNQDGITAGGKEVVK